MRVYTVGHSTRSSEEFIALLEEYRVSSLVDVRRFPTSKRHPHFSREVLEATLRARKIAYTHEPDLGGYRKARLDSPNTAWRVAGFRGYADHMDTPEFRAALARVLERARLATTAIMCAEAHPSRCHRRLISDALVASGHEVVHILVPGETEGHRLDPAARLLKDGRITYPEPPPEQRELL